MASSYSPAVFWTCGAPAENAGPMMMVIVGAVLTLLLVQDVVELVNRRAPER